MTKDMTTGSPVKLILGFAFPMFLGMLFQQFYSMVDTMLVGQFLGVNPLAGVGSTGSLNFMVIGFCTGVCSGFAIPVAQMFGAKQESELRKFVTNSAWLSIVFSIVLTTAVAILCRQILIWMNTPEEIFDYAYDYIFVVFLGIPCTFLYNLLSSIIRSLGDSKTPVIFLAISSVLNIGLDLLLILVIPMGVAGAAWATVIAQGISVGLCVLYVLARVRILIPEKKHFAVGSHLYWELFSQSISMGLMSSIVSAGSVVLQYGINSLGTLVIAGHTAARKLFAFTDMPLTAMASACSTYVSQNYGANHPDRVRRGMRDIYLYGVVVAVTAILLMSVGAEWMVKLVSGSSEPVVLENGVRYLVWNAPFYAVLGMLLSTRYALQSMGEKVLPLLSSVIEFLGKIVFVLLFIPRFEYNAVILCEPVIWCFMTIELLIAYRHNSFVFPKMKK